MSDLTPSHLDAVSTMLKSLCANVGLGLAEQLNADVGLDVQTVDTFAVTEMLADPPDSVYSVFSLSAPYTGESVLLFPINCAQILLGLIKGEEPNTDIEIFTDPDVESLAQVAAAWARGMATALGNLSGETIEVESCASAQGPLALPPVFAMEETAIRVNFVLTTPDMLECPIQFMITPQCSHALLPQEEEAEEPASANSLMGEDELAAMLSELEGIGGGMDPTPMPTPAPAPVQAASAPFANFPTGGGESTVPRGIELILDIPLDVTVELGRVRMLIKDVLELASGSIVELDRVAGEPVDLLVNGRLIAKGEVVVIEDNFGIRLTEIVSPADRVAGLGKGR